MRLFTAHATHLVASLAVTAAAVLTAFAIPAPAHAVTLTLFGNGLGVAGSGKEVQVARPVNGFSVLRLDSSVDVHAHQGSTPSVTVHADDNIEPLIETVVDGDTLIVRTKEGASFHTRHEVYVDVVFTSLTAAKQRGSGDLRIDHLSGAKFDSSITGSGDLRIDDAQVGTFGLNVAGSGDVVLAGTVDEARFGIAGSGDIHASRFAVRRLGVSISGSGDAQVNATESIDAKVAGSGDIVYSGHPHDVSRRVAGSGSIEAAH